MGLILDEAVVVAALVGEWRIGASNIDHWVNGSRRDILLRFSVAQETPLVVAEDQIYTTIDGKERTLALVNRFNGGEFISKAQRIMGAVRRWTIGGMDPESGILIVRMTHERGGQDGLIVLLREGATVHELRMLIATNAHGFGVGPEDFASLTWLPVKAHSAESGGSWLGAGN